MIELPKSLLSNYPSRSSHAFVKALPCVANATSVQLDPLSGQDWELLQQHADQLESGDFLQQISLVYPNQILPVQVGPGRTAMVRVLSSAHAVDDEILWPREQQVESLPPCVRLVAQTEVVVTDPPSVQTPNELRVVPCLEEYKEAVKQLWTENSCVTSLPHPYTVAIHPDAWSQTPGWSQDDDEQFISVRFVKPNGHETETAPSSVAKLVLSTAVQDDCVGTYGILCIVASISL